MSASPSPTAPLDEALARDIVDQAISRYCAKRRAKVDQFAKDNFSFVGSLRLHRHAVGLDVLRAPANLALTAPFLTTQILAKGARMLRRGKSAAWLESRRFYLKTDVARELEWRLFIDFLELPYRQGERVSEHDALAEELLQDPRVEDAIAERLKEAGVTGAS
ncbi:MAG: hypothetical protein CMM31_10295, partial [Rhodospirillaceae bacterium]|nr:hypothetical protein [Rhodospirillaceae bacterium]